MPFLIKKAYYITLGRERLNTKKLSGVISVFINTAIYFVSLSIVIAICAALLTNFVSISKTNAYETGSVITTILCGCMVLYFAGKTEEIAKKIGGSIDNSFGEQLKSDTKNLWNSVRNNAKKFGSMAFKDWLKKK